MEWQIKIPANTLSIWYFQVIFLACRVCNHASDFWVCLMSYSRPLGENNQVKENKRFTLFLFSYKRTWIVTTWPGNPGYKKNSEREERFNRVISHFSFLPSQSPRLPSIFINESQTHPRIKAFLLRIQQSDFGNTLASQLKSYPSCSLEKFPGR